MWRVSGRGVGGGGGGGGGWGIEGEEEGTSLLGSGLAMRCGGWAEDKVGGW